MGTKLNVEIIKVGDKSATAQGKIFFLLTCPPGININVAALKSFKVFIEKVSSDRQLRAGQTVTVKILGVAYTKGVPDITGEILSSPQVKLTELFSHLGDGWLVSWL